MYSDLYPNGSLKLYEFIAMVTVVMIVLSQLPTFHSLRHINLVSLLLSLGYTFLVVGACINAGTQILDLSLVCIYYHALIPWYEDFCIHMQQFISFTTTHHAPKTKPTSYAP